MASPIHDRSDGGGHHGHVAQPLLDRADAARPVLLPPPRPVIVPATDLGGVGVLKHGNIYLLSDPFGDVHPDSRGLGLYDLDTRIVSCAVLRINGVRPTLLRAQSAANHISTIQLTNPEYRRDPALKQGASEALSRRAISIMRRRWIAGGLAEHVEVTNYSETAQRIELDLELDADIADIFEVRGRIRERRGTYRQIVATPESLTFAYEGLDGLVRRTLVSFSPGEVSASATDGIGGGEGAARVHWALEVEPGAKAGVRWEVSTDLTPLPGRSDDAVETPTRLARSVATQSGTDDGSGANDGAADVDDSSAGARRAARGSAIAEPAVAEEEYGNWHDRCARIRSDGELLDLAIRRSIADLRLLRNDGPLRGEHYVAAGVPWFTTLFGRDSIITSLEVVPFMPDVARETLRILADWQATEDDPDRDMEPGKILHELRVGELARTGELPHRPYYGSIDATPLWLILLDETYRWTGDLGMVRSLWPNALAALEWIDRYGDRDGDGFVEYERRTPAGLLNQGWKDSGDAIRHLDGSLAVAPIALVEIQGYVFDAKRRLSSLAERLGEHELSKRLATEAAELQRRFEAAFWMPEIGFYAMALDRDKRQVADDRLERGPLPVERDRPARARRQGGGPAPRPHDGLRLGHSDLRLGPAGLQPGGLPHGLRLAPRQRADRGWDEARGPPRRGGPGRVPDLRGGPALARLPAPRALLRLRPRPRGHARPLPRRLLAPGLVRGHVALPPADDARDARGRGARCAGARPSAPSGLARQGDRARAPGGRANGGPAVPPLARQHHQRRGPAARRAAGARDSRLKG